jgi:maltodextrin utilization protein YvdJ
MEKKESSAAFWVMMIILIYMLVACIICPIAIPGFSKQPYALPMMGLSLALPFVHFFIFAGIEIAKSKTDKK